MPETQGFAQHWPALGHRDSDQTDPFGEEPWDPDVLDDDEPEPEFGDFWPEFDDE